MVMNQNTCRTRAEHVGDRAPMSGSLVNHGWAEGCQRPYRICGLQAQYCHDPTKKGGFVRHFHTLHTLSLLNTKPPKLQSHEDTYLRRRHLFSVISAYFPRPPEFDIDFAPLSGSTGLTVPRHSRNLGGLAAPKNGLGPL